MNRSASQNSRPVAYLAGLVVLAIAAAASAWGFAGHELICRNALPALPPELEGFFTANLASLNAFSVEPDALSIANPDAAPNHFIDLDSYSKPPFADVPSNETEFTSKFGVAALKEGRLPWAIADEYAALVHAFKTGDREDVLRHAGHLSHYVSDATMPLHATANYKGQKTGNVIFDTPDDPNRHVHVRFEIGMIDANIADIAKRLAAGRGKAHEIGDAASEGLALAKVAYTHAGAVLQADKDLLKLGGRVDDAYFAGMYKRVGDVAVGQMVLAAGEVASFWRSAWVAAGKPSLPRAEVPLSKPPLTFDEAKAVRAARILQESAK